MALTCSAMLAACAGCLGAQRADTLTSRLVAPGVRYHQIVDPRGPWMIHLVRVDLTRAGLELRQARALDRLRGRERTSEMARRAHTAGSTILAAVNADFFDLATGENENNQVLGGEWWKGLKVTDSPFDTYDNAHVQLALDAMGRPTIGRFILDGSARARGTILPILTVNASAAGGVEGVVLFTARYGDRTPRDTTRATVEAPMDAAGRRGDTLLFVRRGPVVAASASPIPSAGAVLSAWGARAAQLEALAEGDTVAVHLALSPRPAHRGPPTVVIGGWPRLLDAGRPVAHRSATLEGTISRNAEARHPRTALGVSRHGRTIFLVTVDGRSTRSAGATLVELASLMRRLGAWDAMNFDGGGSTTMVVGDSVVNSPSDATGERPVGNALLVVRRR